MQAGSMNISGFAVILLEIPTSDALQVIRKYEKVVGHGPLTHICIELWHPALHTQHRHNHFDLSYQPPQGHVNSESSASEKCQGTRDKVTILVLS